MLSTEGFFLQKWKGLLQLTVIDNEVSALAMLTFYENRLTGKEIISVRCPH